MSPRVERALLILLLAVVALFHGLTLRPGFDWGGDWAQYLEHARNLSEGKPYGALLYLHNPLGSPSPQIYPPVYPLLMTPLVMAFGIGLVPFQLQSVAFLVVFLWLFHRTWRLHVPAAPLLAAMAAFALHPYLWGCKDLLLSEFPFLCFAQGALWALDRAPERGGVRLGIAAGLLLALAAGTRAVGLALLPLPLVFALWKHRRIPAWTWAATAAAAVEIATLTAVFGAFWRYGEFLSRSYLMSGMGPAYVFRWLAQVTAGPPPAVQWSLFTLFLAAVAAGVWRVLKLRTPHELFLLLLLLPVLIYPSDQGLRYLLPLLPCLFLYAALSVHALAASIAGRVLAAAALAGLLWVYGAVYARTDLRAPVPGSVDPASVEELLSALKEHTPSDAVIASTKPRALALLARRPAVFFPSTGTKEVKETLQRFRVSYLLLSPGWPSDRVWPFRVAQKNPDRFKPVFKNKDFLLFAVASAVPAGGTGGTTR